MVKSARASGRSYPRNSTVWGYWEQRFAWVAEVEDGMMLQDCGLELGVL